jgi:replicative DNA helicase
VQAGDATPDTIFAHGAAVLDLYERTVRGEVGVPFPWPSMTKMTMGMWPGNFALFVGRPGTGKCLKYDTKVMCSSTGAYKTIAAVVRDHDRVLTRHLDGRVTPVTPDAFLPMGPKACVKITMHSGRDLSGTPEHPVWTIDGWTRLDALKVGDFIAMPRVIPEPEQAIHADEHEPELIAALLADANLTNGHVVFTKTNQEIVNRVRSAVEFYGGEMRQDKGEKISYRLGRLGGNQGHGRNPIVEKLEEWGAGRELSRNKTIPDRVFQYDNASLARFLGMFWSCDGSFPSVTSIKGRFYRTAEVGLASREMVYQLQRLLLRLGIHGRIRFKPVKLNGQIFNSWTLTIHSTCYAAMRALPIIGEKAEQCLTLGDSINPNLDNVPITPTLKAELMRIVNAYKDADRIPRYDRLSAALGMTTRISVNKLYRRNTVSRRIFAAFIDAFDADNLRPHLECAWDAIEQIEDDGVHEVFDLTVMDTHSFVANDIIVHNTVAALLIAIHAAMVANKRVLIISPEMSKLEIAERFFGFATRASLTGMVRGTLSGFEEQRLREYVAAMREHQNVWILDGTDTLTPAGMDAAIRKIGPDLVVIDSIYSLRVAGRTNTERTESALDWLNRSDKQYQYAAAVLSQQNRTKELSGKLGGGSRLGTIGFSDRLPQDANLIFAMEQDEDLKLARRMKFVPLKTRRGFFEGAIEVHWDFAASNFEEVARAPADEYVDEAFVPPASGYSQGQQMDAPF